MAQVGVAGASGDKEGDGARVFAEGVFVDGQLVQVVPVDMDLPQ